MKVILLLFLMLNTGLAQFRPPTMMIKKRHGDSAIIKWDFNTSQPWPLSYFSLREGPSLSSTPIEFKQIPSTERETSFVVLFHPSAPKDVYYVVYAVYEGGAYESAASNTIQIDRIGPPPLNSH